MSQNGVHKQTINHETHSFAFHLHRQKDEQFVKKSDRDQIALRARKLANSSCPCSVLIDSG